MGSLLPWTSSLLSRTNPPASKLIPTTISIPPNDCAIINCELLLIDQQDRHPANCQECYKNSAHFAQFLLSFLTYVLLSYFIRLHCANIHTPLPFVLIFTTQNIKTKNSNLLGAREDH